ncbi:division/cell wall cluster transcriptional repressor MraZ [Sphingosinithalassobacter portus]|uniref:division/cell wall cluster transcriptional repressor MraZ n=1 Tax=Stakelama portus TaxID=2676234 RepID=UPI001EFE75EA|nr:division/cell wall cluster transcriptional repressor MraZ [Sphingosinithalassobacter portus]
MRASKWGSALQDRDLYEGFALQAVDEKGRVAIPADLRSAAERNSDVRQVVVGVHPFDPCLSVHDLGWSQTKYARVDREESPFEGDGSTVRAKRRAFGAVERAQFDASGRFVIPPFFRKKAKIARLAFFNGAGETFDIWAPEVLMADTDPANADIREICEFLLEQKGVTL